MNLPVSLFIRACVSVQCDDCFSKNLSWSNRNFENLSRLEEIPFRLSLMVNRMRFSRLCVLRKSSKDPLSNSHR